MVSSSHSSEESRRPATSAPRSWVAYTIGPVFFILAGWFLWGPDMLKIPVKTPVAIDPEQLSIAPRCAILRDPPTINIDGFDRTCMSCHQMFPPREDPPQALAQHKHFILNHGINKQCRNCHDTENRNLLVLRGGETIGYNDVESLCAKCHGPTYRDWQHGAHGRTNGYWDASRGEVRRLQCTECHNPHDPRVPAMDPIAPLPGPDTLRMRHDHQNHGANDVDSAEVEHRDPLRRAIQHYIAADRAEAETMSRPKNDIEYFDEQGDREE